MVSFVITARLLLGHCWLLLATAGHCCSLLFTKYRTLAHLRYTAGGMAKDCVDLLDHLGWERSHILGVSLGGMVAQELALLTPARVATLSLLVTCSNGVGATDLATYGELTKMAFESDVRKKLGHSKFNRARTTQLCSRFFHVHFHHHHHLCYDNHSPTTTTTTTTSHHNCPRRHLLPLQHHHLLPDMLTHPMLHPPRTNPVMKTQFSAAVTLAPESVRYKRMFDVLAERMRTVGPPCVSGLASMAQVHAMQARYPPPPHTHTHT
jgi:hypothetical protein